MLKNSKFYHIVEAVVYIALHAKPNAVRGPEICKAQNLPERYLENSLQSLVHSGILRSVRGPKGGYVLAKERRNITLADIYSSNGDKENTRTEKTPIIQALETAEKAYVQELGKITIESLCIPFGNKSGQQRSDFTI